MTFRRHYDKHYGPESAADSEQLPLVPRKLLTPEQFLALSPNKRFLAVREQIEFTPEHWDQGPVVHAGHQRGDRWCNTTLCTAGWALFLAGEVAIDENGKTKYFNAEGKPTIAERAAELLGIKDDQDMIFYVGERQWPALADRILAENADD